LIVSPIATFVPRAVTSLLRDILLQRRSADASPITLPFFTPGARLGQFTVSYFHRLHATGPNGAGLGRRIDVKASEISDLRYSEAIRAH
jgi:hypothetical protein